MPWSHRQYGAHRADVRQQAFLWRLLWDRASGPVGIAFPQAVILDARAVAHSGNPKVKDARFMKAGEHPESVGG